MQINDYLNKLKGVYQNTTPTLHLKLYGKSELLAKITEKKPAARFLVRFKLAFIAVLLLVIGLAFFGISRIVVASTPGTFLYPVKQASESMIKKAKQGKYLPFDIQSGKPTLAPSKTASPTPEVKGEEEEVWSTTEPQETDTGKKSEEEENRRTSIPENTPQPSSQTTEESREID